MFIPYSFVLALFEKRRCGYNYLICVAPAEKPLFSVYEVLWHGRNSDFKPGPSAFFRGSAHRAQRRKEKGAALKPRRTTASEFVNNLPTFSPHIESPLHLGTKYPPGFPFQKRLTNHSTRVPQLWPPFFCFLAVHERFVSLAGWTSLFPSVSRPPVATETLQT